MTNEELSLKCAEVLGWKRPVTYERWLLLPNGNDRVAEDKLHESPAAVLAMICELGKRDVHLMMLNNSWGALHRDKRILAAVMVSNSHPTPEAALARCVMEAIVEVMK